jgi:shikimate kinase
VAESTSRGRAIVLVGIRGAGKSTLGAALARRLRRPFVDLDREIERRAGQRVATIFARAGEARFRALESAALRAVVARARRGEPLVIATGGGVVERAENLPLLRRAGIVVWLQCGAARVARRLAASRARPSLTGKPVAQEVRALLARRAPRYRQVATLILRAGSSTPEELVERLMSSNALRTTAYRTR